MKLNLSLLLKHKWKKASHEHTWKQKPVRVEAEKEAEAKKSEEALGKIARVGPTPSQSTDESISAYIERSPQTLGWQGTGLDITFLPPTDPVVYRDT